MPKQLNGTICNSLGTTVLDVAWVPDGSRLLTCGGPINADSNVTEWNPKSGEKGRSISLSERTVLRLAVSTDGATIACHPQSGPTVILIDGAMLTVKGHLAASVCRSFEAMAFSPSGKCLAAASMGSDVEYWDLESSGTPSAVSLDPSVISTYLSFLSEELLLVGTDETVEVWNLERTERVRQIRMPGGETVRWNHRLSPDGTVIASFSQYGQIIFATTCDWMAIGEWPRRKQRISDMAWSPDSQYLAVGYEDGMLVLWDVAGSKRRHKEKAPYESVDALAFSPNGETLACLRNKKGRVGYIPTLMLLTMPE